MCIRDSFGPHAVTPPVRIISLIAADQRYQQREHKRLDKTFRDVGHQDTACLLYTSTCQRVDLPDGFNLVSEKFQTQGAFVLIRRNHFQHVAANPERSPVKIHIIALVLNIHKLGDDSVHADTLTDLDRNDQTCIVFRLSLIHIYGRAESGEP